MKRDFECASCNETFTQKRNLNDHIQALHENIRNQQCQLCNFTCSFESNLKKHVKTVHEKLREFKCDHCTKSFSAKNNLKKHKATLHNDLWIMIIIFHYLQFLQFSINLARWTKKRFNSIQKQVMTISKIWHVTLVEKYFGLKLILIFIFQLFMKVNRIQPLKIVNVIRICGV